MDLFLPQRKELKRQKRRFIMSNQAINQLHAMQRKMQFQMKMLPYRAKVILFIALVLSLSMYGSLFHYFFWYNHTSRSDYLELHKCPACYGQSLCEELKEGAGKYTGYSKLQFLNKLANVKNVNFGKFAGKDVVYKKLAHDWELDKFDKLMCTKAGSSVGCDTTKAMLKIYGSGRNIDTKTVKGSSDLTACPSRRLVDKIVDKYQEKADAIDISFPEKVSLITTLNINPEPILFQTFPREEGYPFPKYYGACGRFIVVENAGKSLSEYYNAPWEERIDYATQIFRMADLFSDPPSSFALYWVDITYDNFAVGSDGKVRIVDGENIIVVDKWKIKQDKNSDWDTPHYSDFDDCKKYGTCLGFEVEMLCNRYTCDHNYYAACRNLLSSYGSDFNKPGGLLHDTPDEINQKYNLDEMLRECAKPSNPGGRMEIKDKLLQTMEEIRRSVT